LTDCQSAVAAMETFSGTGGCPENPAGQGHIDGIFFPVAAGYLFVDVGEFHLLFQGVVVCLAAILRQWHGFGINQRVKCNNEGNRLNHIDKGFTAMHAALSLANDPVRAVNTPVHADMHNLMVELDCYRRRSEWLLKINDLHARLAGALDLSSKVEAFSVWLMPVVEHTLIAYSNPQLGRQHLFCSCHGPERRRVMTMADKMIGELACKGGETCWQEDGFFVYCWPVPDCDGGGRLLLLRRAGVIGGSGIEQIGEGLSVLQEPLQRAVEYEDIFEQARRDSLTGLANRRVFEDRLDPLIESARRHGRPITLASMDLDYFKQINDTFGHAKGDQVLRMVAQAMSGMVRTSDLLVRIGGDEFLLLMPETELANARILIERLCKAVNGLAIQAPGAPRLGVSIGLTQWQAGLSKEEWLQRTDEALYQAKANGRSQAFIG